MKKPKIVILVVLIVLAFATLVTTVFSLSTRYLKNESESNVTEVACEKLGTTHIIYVTDESVTPSETQAKLCDSLTVINNSTKIRIMAFGPHEDHQAYDGVTEKDLAVGKSFTINFNQPGTFRIHDHTDDELAAYFTVSN